MNYKKKFNKEEIIKYPIDKEELDQLENSITNNYFEFEIDTIDLYDKSIIPYNFKEDKEIINIDDNFYKNINIYDINKVKTLIKDINSLNTYKINYDFITNKELEDLYINNVNNIKNINDEDYLDQDDVNNDYYNNDIEITKNKTNENPKEKEENKIEKDLEEDYLKEKLLIDNKFITFNKKYNDHNTWWQIEGYICHNFFI